MSAGYGKIGTFVHCWWECKVVLVTVQTSMAVPQKKLKPATILPRNSTAGYIDKRIASKDLKRYLCITAV